MRVLFAVGLVLLCLSVVEEKGRNVYLVVGCLASVLDVVESGLRLSYKSRAGAIVSYLRGVCLLFVASAVMLLEAAYVTRSGMSPVFVTVVYVMSLLSFTLNEGCVVLLCLCMYGAYVGQAWLLGWVVFSCVCVSRVVYNVLSLRESEVAGRRSLVLRERAVQSERKRASVYKNEGRRGEVVSSCVLCVFYSEHIVDLLRDGRTRELQHRMNLLDEWVSRFGCSLLVVHDGTWFVQCHGAEGMSAVEAGVGLGQRVVEFLQPCGAFVCYASYESFGWRRFEGQWSRMSEHVVLNEVRVCGKSRVELGIPTKVVPAQNVRTRALPGPHEWECDKAYPLAMRALPEIDSSPGDAKEGVLQRLLSYVLYDGGRLGVLVCVLVTLVPPDVVGLFFVLFVVVMYSVLYAYKRELSHVVQFVGILTVSLLVKTWHARVALCLVPVSYSVVAIVPSALYVSSGSQRAFAFCVAIAHYLAQSRLVWMRSEGALVREYNTRLARVAEDADAEMERGWSQLVPGVYQVAPHELSGLCVTRDLGMRCYVVVDGYANVLRMRRMQLHETDVVWSSDGRGLVLAHEEVCDDVSGLVERHSERIGVGARVGRIILFCHFSAGGVTHTFLCDD